MAKSIVKCLEFRDAVQLWNVIICIFYLALVCKGGQEEMMLRGEGFQWESDRSMPGLRCSVCIEICANSFDSLFVEISTNLNSPA